MNELDRYARVWGATAVPFGPLSDTQWMQHLIDFHTPRGPMYAVYCVIKFVDGGKHTEVMTKEDVDRIRARSRAGNSGPWVTDYDEMAKKTVFRRASKWVKLTPEVQDVLDREDAPAPALVSEIANPILALPEVATEPEAEPDAPAPIEMPTQAAAPPAPPAQAPPDPQPANSELLHTVQQTLAEVITSAGFTFNHFQTWAVETGNVPEAGSLPGFDDVPTNHCKRLLRAQAGLLKGLAMVKGGQL